MSDLPPELHKALKESAERNRRSLNAEIIWRLENSESALRRISPEEFKERLDRFHEYLRRTNFKPPTDEEITRYKNQGRP